MYLCTDTKNMYYDESEGNNGRKPYFYTSVKTLNDLRYYITPAVGTSYYCWEDNSLWLWNNKWIALYVDSSYPDAYVYDVDGRIQEVYNNNTPGQVIDNNGLLKDGSVVIRDRNRLIKGKIFVEDGLDNLIISSFLGGGIRFLPNGRYDEDGELFIGDEGQSFLRSQFHVLNNELYIDYTEISDLDPSEYPNQQHLYKVYHEGNLDASAIKVLTPEEIYNKLRDSSLPSPLDLNVKSISGKTIDDIALIGHSHVAADITDFVQRSREQATVAINSIFTGMIGEGINISYASSTSSFKMSANNFDINITGGAVGSATVRHLADTTIDVTVDPSRHVHQNYINRMNELQDEIDAISGMDPANYYNKNQIDNMISTVEGTELPTIGKPLLVNSNLILPGTADKTNKLANSIDIIITGDIEGTVNTDLSSNVTINVNAGNIISTTPTANKALLVDSEGNLPANALSSSQLDHEITLSLIGEAIGSANLDTSLNSYSMNVTLNPGSNILQDIDLGTRVASLGIDGKIPASQLPASQAGTVPMGYFNPNNGYPSNNPTEGQFWVADTEGTLGNRLYQVDDWIIYLNSQWNKVDTNDNVLSVNGLTGALTLDADDVNAISNSYIDYTLGNIIPQNKIVLTSQEGIIEGATVNNLTNAFNIEMATNSRLDIETTSSTTSTDGSNDITLDLRLNNNAYDDIKTEVLPIFQANRHDLPYKKYISFGSGLTVNYITNDQIELTADGGSSSDYTILWYDTIEPFNSKFKDEFINAYLDRATKPIIIFEKTGTNRIMNYYFVDHTYPDLSDNLNISLSGGSYEVSAISDSRVNNKLKLISKTTTLNINIKFSSEASGYIVDTIIKASDSAEFADFLSMDRGSSTGTPFEPISPNQPTTKNYVDNSISTAIASVTPKTFTQQVTIQTAGEIITLTHNLDTLYYIMQIRDIDTGYQIFDLKNVATDENTIEISTPFETEWEGKTIAIMIMAIN